MPRLGHNHLALDLQLGAAERCVHPGPQLSEWRLAVTCAGSESGGLSSAPRDAGGGEAHPSLLGGIEKPAPHHLHLPSITSNLCKRTEQQKTERDLSHHERPRFWPHAQPQARVCSELGALLPLTCGCQFQSLGHVT